MIRASKNFTYRLDRRAIAVGSAIDRNVAVQDIVYSELLEKIEATARKS